MRFDFVHLGLKKKEKKEPWIIQELIRINPHFIMMLTEHDSDISIKKNVNNFSVCDSDEGC